MYRFDNNNKKSLDGNNCLVIYEKCQNMKANTKNRSLDQSQESKMYGRSVIDIFRLRPVYTYIVMNNIKESEAKKF